jgi:DNA anti-recombination protein RmuC
MLSSDDNTYTSTEPIERSFRAASRRELINEKRQRNTDILTYTNGENEKTVVRQLREENKRLRWELDELQHLAYQHKQTQAQLEKEIEAIHSGHQDIIEQYEINLHEMIDERNQLQEAKQALEQRYQELYHSFHDTVEEEATKMVEEAARTLVLSPEHTPALLRDVAKTLEFQVKQNYSP